ncbi:alpha/beta hydrolase fold domain-containing protein [Mycobacterium sp. RTGN5]|uniref:alpha/beta hydrolase fold domain-containing protein n=1 Tax=Mycobacterium sp. RTGN5 TaxID=3016522 RepID=UPI0029C90D03|nr:alpha/beta hydrolase fold domain-containing protein [Mycobacterium sp. RTGN5]
MGAGGHIGRVGGLAVALGIGAAVWTGIGAPAAVADSSGTPGSASSDSAKTPSAGRASNKRVKASQTLAGTSKRPARVKVPDPGPASPAAPIALSQVVTAAATTRRLAPRPTAAPATSSEPVATESVSAAPAPNSVTYTAPSSLSDRLTLATLRLMRVVSNVLGTDIYGLVGKALASANPPSFLLGGLTATKTTYTTAEGAEWKVWEFTPPDPSGKAVVAIHGGGFILQPLLLHWIDYTNMARDTGATVIVPMYPLATTEAGAAVHTIPAMADFISAQIDTFGPENVSIYADSAGPNIAIGAVRLLLKAGKPVPASMVLLSFAPDPTLSNPDIKKTNDPIIDVNNIAFYTNTNHWGDGVEKTDPLINAMNFEDAVLQELPPTTLYVGSTEFLLPDTLLFQKKVVDAGGTMSVVIGSGQIHDWALGVPVNSQAMVVRRDIYRQLGLIPAATTV